MTYRNIHNGRVIDIPAVLTSPDWEEIGTEKPAVKKKEKAVNADERKKTVRTGK